VNKGKTVIEYLRKSGDFSESFLSFYEDIFKAQNKNYSAIDKEEFFSDIEEKDILESLYSGEPLLNLKLFQQNKTYLDLTFSELIKVMKTHKLQDVREIKKIEEFKKSRIIDSAELAYNGNIGDVTYFEKLGKKHGVNIGLLMFFSLSLANPILDLVAGKIRPFIDKDQWDFGYCPVCGNNPAFSKFKKETGERILWCAWCYTEWTFKHTMCPFCGNQDQTSLKRFSVGRNTPYGIEACEKCKRYIKIIDEKKIAENKEITMLAEEFLTYYLDDMAAKKGYSK